MIIREIEKPRLRDFINPANFRFGGRQKMLEKEVFDGIKIVGSGKAAIAIILKYLQKKNVIVNKLDEVLVPDWVGYWVYNQIHPFAFPTKNISGKTKAMLVYHQYGFPQNMDKILEFAHDRKLIVIEDCAHALDSYYKGKPLGSMGDFALYSFSKWFFCFALGGVKSKYEDFSAYANKLVAASPLGLTFIKDSAKFLSDYSSFSQSDFFKKSANFFMSMSYALYGDALKPSRLAVNLFNNKIKNEIEIRRKRYGYFLEKTKNLGVCDHLEKEGITPYVIPIICQESKNEKLARALREKNIITGIYHFDINRNLLAPNFVPVVWIPCHSGISDSEFDSIIELVLKIL